MALAYSGFDKRLRRIVKNHQRMANGVTYRVDDNGLIQAQPRIYNPKFPLRGLLLLVVTAFLFKGFIFASLGEQTYNERVGKMDGGSVVEQAGSWIMQADPATRAVAEVMQGLGI